MTKQLRLLGAALAHVNLLAHLGQHPLPGVQVTSPWTPASVPPATPMCLRPAPWLRRLTAMVAA